MAKQNNDNSFADSSQQNRKETKIISYETRKRKNKTRKKQRGKIPSDIVIWVIPLIILMIDICYGTKLLSWAEEMNKRGVYLNFIAENMLDTAMLVIEILLFIGTVFLALMKKKRWTCAAVSVIMLVTLYVLTATKLKVAASVESDKELIVSNIEKCMSVLSNVNIQEKYQLRQYILEEDIYIENVEQYCGMPDNSISGNERIDIMAKIIMAYLKNHITNTSVEELPDSYETNVLLADIRYGGFSYYKKQSEQPENGSIINELYDCGLTELDAAIECRIKADNALSIAENCRLLGVYYIDKGALQKDISGAGDVAVCYERAAEWAVKSICFAAMVNDAAAMKKAWNVLDNAYMNLEDVEGSSDAENVKKVKNIKDAYAIVIDQWK